MSKKLSDYADVLMKESFYGEQATASLKEERNKIKTFAEYTRQTHFPTEAVDQFWLRFFDLARGSNRIVEECIASYCHVVLLTENKGRNSRNNIVLKLLSGFKRWKFVVSQKTIDSISTLKKKIVTPEIDEARANYASKRIVQMKTTIEKLDELNFSLLNATSSSFKEMKSDFLSLTDQKFLEFILNPLHKNKERLIEINLLKLRAVFLIGCASAMRSGTLVGLDIEAFEFHQNPLD